MSTPLIISHQDLGLGIGQASGRMVDLIFIEHEIDRREDPERIYYGSWDLVRVFCTVDEDEVEVGAASNRVWCVPASGERVWGLVIPLDAEDVTIVVQQTTCFYYDYNEESEWVEFPVPFDDTEKEVTVPAPASRLGALVVMLQPFETPRGAMVPIDLADHPSGSMAVVNLHDQTVDWSIESGTMFSPESLVVAPGAVEWLDQAHPAPADAAWRSAPPALPTFPTLTTPSGGFGLHLYVDSELVALNGISAWNGAVIRVFVLHPEVRFLGTEELPDYVGFRSINTSATCYVNSSGGHPALMRHFYGPWLGEE